MPSRFGMVDGLGAVWLSFKQSNVCIYMLVLVVASKLCMCPVSLKKKNNNNNSETVWSAVGLLVLVSIIQEFMVLNTGSSRISGVRKSRAAAAAAAVSSTKENPCAPRNQFPIVPWSMFHMKCQILSSHEWREAWSPSGFCNGFFSFNLNYCWVVLGGREQQFERRSAWEVCDLWGKATCRKTFISSAHPECRLIYLGILLVFVHVLAK